MACFSYVPQAGRSVRALLVAGVIALALSLALLAPAMAAGKTYRHSGTVVGDKATKLSFKVRTKGGRPAKVLDFTAKGIVTRCDGTVNRFNFTVFVPLEINDRGNFKARLPDDNGAVLRVTGKTKNDGRKAVGNIKSNRFTEAGMSCQTPKQRFKTSV